jgi:hypothetical protein
MRAISPRTSRSLMTSSCFSNFCLGTESNSFNFPSCLRSSIRSLWKLKGQPRCMATCSHLPGQLVVRAVGRGVRCVCPRLHDGGGAARQRASQFRPIITAPDGAGVKSLLRFLSDCRSAFTVTSDSALSQSSNRVHLLFYCVRTRRSLEHLLAGPRCTRYHHQSRD